MKIVSSPRGRVPQSRGVYARAVKPGEVRAGDSVRKTSDLPMAAQAGTDRHTEGAPSA